MIQRRNRKAFELPREYFQVESWAIQAMYDGMMRLLFPMGVKIVSFADDITLLVYGEIMEEVE